MRPYRRHLCVLAVTVFTGLGLGAQEPAKADLRFEAAVPANDQAEPGPTPN